MEDGRCTKRYPRDFCEETRWARMAFKFQGCHLRTCPSLSRPSSVDARICTARPQTVMEEPRLKIDRRESSTGVASYNVAAVLRCRPLPTWLPDLLGNDLSIHLLLPSIKCTC